MTTLITGSTGLIGSRLCKHLADANNTVCVVGLTHKMCDIGDYGAVFRAVRLYHPDTVFHFAAHLPSTTNPDFVRVNVLGTSNLLDVCHNSGVRNFIYASSMSVYAAPPVRLPVDEKHTTKPYDAYGKTKLIGELLCKRYIKTMKVTIVRFSSVFGPGDNSRVAYYFMRSALSGQAIQVDGDGSQSSDFIYVDDAVLGAVLVADKGKSGEIYNIGSGKETSVLELASTIARLGEPEVEVKLSGKPATRPFRFVSDVDKARKELGYCPGDLVTGLKRYREEITGDNE